MALTLRKPWSKTTETPGSRMMEYVRTKDLEILRISPFYEYCISLGRKESLPFPYMMDQSIKRNVKIRGTIS